MFTSQGPLFLSVPLFPRPPVNTEAATLGANIHILCLDLDLP